jgi:glycosyltransferase involved in cell wall biosynthesis
MGLCKPLDTDLDTKRGMRASGTANVRVAVLCRHNLSILEPGDKIHTYEKIMALARHAEVTLFTPYGYASRKMRLHMRIVHVSSSGLIFVLLLAFALFRHRKDYDCIYSRDPLLVAFAVPLKAFGKALIIEMNGIPSREAKIQRQTHRMRFPQLTPVICAAIWLTEAFAIRSADLVFPVTEKMRRYILNEYRADAERAIVIPNSVDTTVFRPLENKRTEIRHQLGIERGIVVLYLSTFSARWRGSDQLFQVAYDIQRKRRDIVFLVVGFGPLLAEIRSKVTEHGIQNQMLFVGAVDHWQIPFYFSAADFYVYDATPTGYELVGVHGPCPTKILESMSCCRPVIAPNEVEIQDMMRKSNGGFCASSLREMEYLIERFADSPELARSMGMSARRYVEANYDLTCLTELSVKLMSKVVHRWNLEMDNDTCEGITVT